MKKDSTTKEKEYKILGLFTFTAPEKADKILRIVGWTVIGISIFLLTIVVMISVLSS